MQIHTKRQIRAVSWRAMAGIVLVTVGLLVGLKGVNAADDYRPEKAKRALNTDQYSLSVQKNNRIDLHTAGGLPIVENAYPAVTLAGDGSRPLRIDFRQSERISISNGLGKGNGLRFQSRECVWTLATYPGQPFITVDLTFVNSGKKPVQVARLSPWTTGNGRSGALYIGPPGTGPAVLQQHADGEKPYGQLVAESDASMGHVAVENLQTGDSFIAAFLTHGAGVVNIRVSDPPSPDGSVYHHFEAWCEYATPETVPPGGELRADTLYLGIREQDSVEGLMRFVAASERLDPYPTLAPAYRHGWQVDSLAGQDESTIRAAMDGLAQEGVGLGWSHVQLGKSWMAGPEGLAIDAGRFPSGLAPLAVYAHGRGETLGITIPAPSDGDVAALASFISDCATWGLDSISLEYENSAGGTTHPRAIYDALRGLDYGGPQPAYSRPLAIGAATPADLGEASRQFYLGSAANPLLITPGREARQDGRQMSDGQFVAAFTLAALCDANLRPAIPFSAQPELRQQVLSRLVPGVGKAAQPLGLFRTTAPLQWYLPLKTEAGVWTIVGIFNSDQDTPSTNHTPLQSFGLNPGVRYTVYDFWAGEYLGVIKDTLKVEVPTAGVRLLGLRYAEQRPMLVATNRHFTQGALDHDAITWSHEEQRLSGTFQGTKGFPYTLTFHLPTPYALKDVECSETILERREDGEALYLSLTPSSEGKITWALQF